MYRRRLSASTGPVQCIRTNGDGLCAVHSVFGTVRTTRYRNQTELFHSDARAFIHQSFGMDYISFSRKLDSPSVLAELEDLAWFDLIRPACLFSLGLGTEALSNEARRVWGGVSSDVDLHQRCLAEVDRQETAKNQQNEIRQQVVQAFSAICVDTCERIVLRPLLLALDLLDEFESEAPYYVSETDGQAYITFPDVLFPVIGPATKYLALFDQRPCFQKFRVDLLERYGARMVVFREKFLDVIHGLEVIGPHWADICRVADLLNELQDCCVPRSGPFPGFFGTFFPSYVAALSDKESPTDYYLSTVELIALCKCTNRNVIIVRRFADEHLEYERHSITDPTRPTVVTSIISNNIGAVRSHFERVMTVTDLSRQNELRDAAASSAAKRAGDKEDLETRDDKRLRGEDKESRLGKEERRSVEEKIQVAMDRDMASQGKTAETQQRKTEMNDPLEFQRPRTDAKTHDQTRIEQNETDSEQEADCARRILSCQSQRVSNFT